MRTFTSTEQLEAAIGEYLGATEWIEIDQGRVDLFADATDDHQWIHVDEERAAAGPFGGTIAHGYLTLSLASFFLPQIARYECFSMAINYGVDKARFITPVPSGGRVRGVGAIVSATEIPGGAQVVVRLTIELEGAAKPAAVVDTVTRYLA